MTGIFKTFRVVLATGGFDPIHSGHIDYLKDAEKLGDILYVGVNSDEWLIRKKDKYFMPIQERLAVVSALKPVTAADVLVDKDNTACEFITKNLNVFPEPTQIIFANGGDRTNTTTPEYEMFRDHPRVQFAWGVGGENKKNSSSIILKKWKETQKKT